MNAMPPSARPNLSPPKIVAACWLDAPLTVTFFKNFAATEKREEQTTLRVLGERIQATTAPTKAELPWLKLALFGNEKTQKKSLRHDANITGITGIEADYDSGQITVSDAVEKLEQAGIVAMVYTSPSHHAEKPRWRVLCPTSRDLPADERERLMGRLNGLFGGVFAAESWARSQAYYFGSVLDNPSHEVHLVDGTPVDEHDELDEIWTGKPGTATCAAAVGRPTAGPMDEAAALDAIATGASYHTAGVRLLGRWARDGVAYMDARNRLIAAFDEVPVGNRDARWQARRADLDRCLDDIYGKHAEAKDRTSGADMELWADPDMRVLRLGRREPPALPLKVFGPAWSPWIAQAAEAAAAPPDYVVITLLAAASALIGHARWAQATPGWCEPPHLWTAAVGDSGSSKSPAADCLLRDVLPVIEQRMMGDFPDRVREWRAASEAHTVSVESWKADVKTARKSGHPPPLPPSDLTTPEPQAPRLRQSDVTVERVATLLCTAAPKGLLISRDELAGWLTGMNAYNDAGRAFWLEAYGGRPYRVERVKSPEPIIIPRLAVAVTGSIQPDRLADMFRGNDDGLLGRFIWAWPDPLPFRLGKTAPSAGWAIDALDRLRLLELAPGTQSADTPHPVMVPLAPEAVILLEEFGAEMQARQQDAGGLLRSAYGKARGLVLRLSLVLEMLRWCGAAGMSPPPAVIGVEAFEAAAALVDSYFLPMAQRVYGDAAATEADRNAATLARWIRQVRPAEVHVRKLQREVRLPGLNRAEAIHAAADVLVEAGWLAAPVSGAGSGRPRAAYPINPAVFEAPA